MRKVSIFAAVGVFISSIYGIANAQTVEDSGIQLDGRNVITTAVPFLQITPDSRSGGMGEAGVAISPDANSTHWNPSKLAFVEGQGGVGMSFTPWLRGITNDIYLFYLSGHHRIDDLSAVGASMRYFSLGDINLRDDQGESLGDHRPFEMAFDASYSRMLSDNFSVGLSLRYIYSNLTGNTVVSGVGDARPGRSIAGDVSAYYFRDIEMFEIPTTMAFGVNISNLGNKMTYTDETQRNFIPANLKLGTTFDMEFDEFNRLAVSLDLNKLLVPTPPIYYQSASGDDSLDQNNQPVIRKGMDDDVPVMQGVIQSFYDAPGGFSETMKEINPSIGLEYWYANQLAIRTGYFYEHADKGNRQYLTLGLGIRYNILGIDFAYLVPTSRERANVSPLQNTLRFSLTIKLGEGSSVNEEE